MSTMDNDFLRSTIEAREGDRMSKGLRMVPREPTEAMLIAARDWSEKKYGKPIGSPDATGCWQTMLDAATNDKCKADKSGIGGNDPQDCDWPGCGCDPYASEVIATLEESGFRIVKDAPAAKEIVGGIVAGLRTLGFDFSKDMQEIVEHRITEALAAAHAEGREEMREEVAKVADEAGEIQSDDLAMEQFAFDIAAAIRALPKDTGVRP